MLSIGRFAKLANVSPRTVRYYESIGLIKSASRGDNNYRYYDSHLVDKVTKIRDLQELGFSLEEIKDILKISGSNFVQSLQQKLQEVEKDIQGLRERHLKLKSLLSVSIKIDSKESINDTERKQYMEAIQEEILSSLKCKHGTLTTAQLDYLKRDRSFETEEQRDFIQALKKCLDFAKEKNLTLGPARGSASASIVLYALGISAFDPTHEGLYPERLLTQAPNIHIDVEFEKGQEFVDFCKETTRKLKYGQIQAFKMPLIDIINNVNARLEKPICFHEIDDNSDLVLGPIRQGDLEKIFHFDMSEEALIMKFESTLPSHKGLSKFKEYVTSQKICNYRDVLNIISLWRPFCQEMIDKLEQYRLAKEKVFSYEFLAPELQLALKPNFGLVLYQEDITRILAHYTGWSYERCSILRRDHAMQKIKNLDEHADFQEFKSNAPPEVVKLFLDENRYTFCKPHVVSFSVFTKITAILKSLHKDIYYEEIAKWEQKNKFCWDDIGVNWKGVSLLQN